MKSKFFRLMVASVLVLSYVLGSAAAGQKDNQTAPKPGKGISAEGVKTLMPPDIEVKVEAFLDAAATRPIHNGEDISDATATWVRFTVKNTSNTPTGNFTYKLVASLNSGAKLYDPPAAQLSLVGKEAKVFGPVKLSPDSSRYTLSARVLADIGNFVKESNEQNNKAEIQYSGLFIK